MKIPHFFRLIFFLGLVFVLFFADFKGVATGEDDLERQCSTENIEESEKKLSREDYQKLLKECLEYLEQKENECEKNMKTARKKEWSLRNEIYYLKNKINKLDNEIYQSNLMIKSLTLQIADTQNSIDKTSLRVENLKKRLANILQTIYEEHQRSWVEIFFQENNISDFFDNLVALEMLDVKNKELLEDIKELKDYLSKQKESLDKEKQEMENLVMMKTLQRKEQEQARQKKEWLRKMTESEYQKYLKEKEKTEKRAADIRAKIFELLEVPKGGIKFEDAVKVAQSVSRLTGVRAAFSLAILWQETRIGKLRGGCYLRNIYTGEGIYIETGKRAPHTMCPGSGEYCSRRRVGGKGDIPHFLDIVKELNSKGIIKTDAFHTPVSCCMYRKGKPFGWGGAMGPAQFIPSTWMLYKKEIEKKTGKSPANPWDIRDAFLANGLYLRDLGASAQTYQKEINAALRYFGCTSYWCRKYYGEKVMEVAECCQQYIDKGTMSSYCEDLVFHN